MYTNVQILSAVISKWAKPLINQVLVSRLGQFAPVAAASEWVKKYFPVASNYSIVNDLSFLAVPAAEMMVAPMVGNAIAKTGLQDAQIPEYAMKIVDAMVEEVKKNGKISLFNTIELEESDVLKLRDMIIKNMPVSSDNAVVEYEVIE